MTFHGPTSSHGTKGSLVHTAAGGRASPLYDYGMPRRDSWEAASFKSGHYPIEQGSLSLLSSDFWLHRHQPPPKYTLTLVLGLCFPKHILRVSFTDCSDALQMAQHFADERV